MNNLAGGLLTILLLAPAGVMGQSLSTGAGSPVAAPRWISIAINSNRVTYLDVNSLKRTVIDDDGMQEAVTASATFMQDMANLGDDRCVRTLAAIGMKCTPSMQAPFASTSWPEEFNSQRRLSRTTYFHTYLGHMGGGEIVPSDSLEAPTPWRSVPPDSGTAQAMGLACNGLPYGVLPNG